VLPLSASLRAQAVNLINEDDARGVAARHLKQAADHALTFTPAAAAAAAEYMLRAVLQQALLQLCRPAPSESLTQGHPVAVVQSCRCGDEHHEQLVVKLP
jgi:hypothetical protein